MLSELWFKNLNHARARFMDLHARLKAERERLKLSQPELGARVGVGKTTVINWEKGASAPDGLQLEKLAAEGADVLYIVTGERPQEPGDGVQLMPDERMVLEGYRLLDARGKAGVMALIGGMSPTPPKKGPSQVFHGDVGQVIKAQRPFKTTTTINVGKPGKPKK